jgi:hypothetical protein
MRRAAGVATAAFLAVTGVAAGQAFEDVSATHVVRSTTAASLFGGSLIDTDGDGDLEVVVAASPWSLQDVAPKVDPASVPRPDRLVGSFAGSVDRGFVLVDARGRAGYSMDAAAIDVDGDGDQDVLVAVEYYPNRLFINDGKGKLTEESWRLPRAVHDSEDIAVADFDGDGDLDAVVVSEDDLTNEYYLNNGRGIFLEAGHLLPVQGISNAVLALDVNGDGAPDLVIGNRGQSFIVVNDGKGMFRDETAARLPVQAETTQDIAAGDVDGDGDEDLVFGNEHGQDRLLLNNGKGRFLPAPEANLPPPPDPTDSRVVKLADVDRDGDLDVFFGVVAEGKAGLRTRNRLLVNDGKGRFTDETDARLPGPDDDTFAAVFLDLDGDGDLDLVSSHTHDVDPAAILAWANDGTGRFSPAPGTYFGEKRSGDILAFVPADLDGDGATDLYVANRGQPDQVLVRRKTDRGAGNVEDRRRNPEPRR